MQEEALLDAGPRSSHAVSVSTNRGDDDDDGLLIAPGVVRYGPCCHWCRTCSCGCVWGDADAEVHSSLQQPVLGSVQGDVEKTPGRCVCHCCPNMAACACHTSCCTCWKHACRALSCKTRGRCVTLWTCAIFLLLLSFLLLFLYVLLPWKAQGMLNQATLEFTKVQLTGANGTSRIVDMVSSGYLTNLASYKTTIHAATLGVNLLPNASSAYNRCLDTPYGCFIGHLQAPAITVDGLPGKNPINLVAPFTVVNALTFADFSSIVLTESHVTFVLHGEVTVTTDIHGLSFTVPHLKLRKTLVLPAMNNLHNVTLGVFGAKIIGDHNQVLSYVDVTVNNPSPISVSPMGNLLMNMTYAGGHVATLSVPDAQLSHGSNVLHMSGILDPVNMVTFTDMFTRFLNGEPSSVFASGVHLPQEASSVALYAPVARRLNLETVLKPLQFPLGMQSTMYVALLSLFKGQFPVQLLLHNPFEAPVSFHAVNLRVSYQGVEIGSCDTSQGSDGKPLHVTLPGKASTWTEKIQVSLDDSGWAHIKAAIKALGEELFNKSHIALLSLEGSITLSVGNLKFSPHYAQPHHFLLPTCLHDHQDLCTDYVKAHPTWPL